MLSVILYAMRTATVKMFVQKECKSNAVLAQQMTISLLKSAL